MQLRTWDLTERHKSNLKGFIWKKQSVSNAPVACPPQGSLVPWNGDCPPPLIHQEDSPWGGGTVQSLITHKALHLGINTVCECQSEGLDVRHHTSTPSSLRSTLLLWPAHRKPVSRDHIFRGLCSRQPRLARWGRLAQSGLCTQEPPLGRQTSGL